MKKRVFTVITSTVLTLGILIGCGKEAGEVTDKPADESVQTSEETSDTQDTQTADASDSDDKEDYRNYEFDWDSVTVEEVWRLLDGASPLGPVSGREESEYWIAKAYECPYILPIIFASPLKCSYVEGLENTWEEMLPMTGAEFAEYFGGICEANGMTLEEFVENHEYDTNYRASNQTAIQFFLCDGSYDAEHDPMYKDYIRKVQDREAQNAQ